MAKQNFKVDIDLEQNAILQAKVQNEGTAPTGPVIGQIYFDTGIDKMGVYTNSGWLYFLGSSSGGGSGYVDAITAAQSAIHITMAGDTAQITITNATVTKDGFMSAGDKKKIDNATDANDVGTLVERDGSGIISVSQITITGIPVNPTDAATKSYVDNLVQGLKTKLPARAISTSDISLTGAQTIDGISLVVGDRVLVTGQTTDSENGIYEVATGAWSRTNDLNTDDEAANVYLFIEEGSSNADTGWVCTSNSSADVVGTDDLEFVKFSSAGVIEAGQGLTKVGNIINAIAGDNSIKVNTSNIVVNIDPVGAITVTGAGIGVDTDGTHIKIVGNKITIGDGVTKTVYEAVTLGNSAKTITHGLGSKNVHVTVIDASSGEEYMVSIKHTTINDVTVEANSTTNVIVIVSGNIGISV